MNEEEAVPCSWTQTDNEVGDVWETECGEAHVFFVDGPVENKCRFCCYCGKPLREVKLPAMEAEP